MPHLFGAFRQSPTRLVRSCADMRARHLCTSILLAAGLLLCTSEARADGPFEGDWRQGATSIDVQVQTWGADCGPRPQSSTVPARGTVHVTQDGDHLAFGARRSTRGCWSDNRAVRLVSSRVGSGSWTILCRTPADDPRRETGNYTLRSTGQERIELRDETAYDWALNASHCTATVISTQTFERIAGVATNPVQVEPVTPTEPAEPACTPGPAARIAMRPAGAEIEPGGRLCFQPRVVDAAGCSVRGARVDLSVDAAQGTISGSCFEASGAGTATITGRANGLEARATVQVRQSDLSGLIARRVESGDLAADPSSAPGRDAGVAVHTTASGGPSPWLLVVAAVSVLLAILSALALASRSRKRAAELRARAEREGSHARAVAAARHASTEPAVAAPVANAETGNAMICPVCRRGYAVGVTGCPRDKEKLVPYAEFVTRRAQSAPERVCSKCGERYASTVTFCGKDGTPLG